jgi:hypothetical protein
MPDDAVSYPADAGATAYLLTVRGTLAPTSLDEARTVHDATAGAAPSVAAARSLGDLSHSVYAGRGDVLGGQLLFIDFWNSLSGLGQFFENPAVAASAGQLFADREAVVWAPAEGFGNVHLPAPSGRTAGVVGLLRTTVTSLEKAASAFTAYSAATINRARSQGLVAHSTWTRVPAPGEQPTPEVISVDVWMDGAAMDRYYELSLGFEHLAPVFAGQPETSSWQSAPGQWAEW